MKPIRLVLQAFGSYPSTLDVDFVKLGRHGIFSITGPTGAGKTTIFDSMVYALYGDLPGKRESSDVRSHFASDVDETFVAFEFEVRGIRWNIERRPEQLRPKKSGTGLTTHLGSIVLRRSDQTSGGFTKVREVTAKVEQLIGLTKNQFQQVVLLPQGEFEAVLKAETKERTDLLRQLFPVEIFQEFTDQLKTEVVSRREILKDLQGDRTAKVRAIREALVAIGKNLPALTVLTWDVELLDAAIFREDYIAEFSSTARDFAKELQSLATTASEQASTLANEVQQAKETLEKFDEWQTFKKEQEGFPAQIAADAQLSESLVRAEQLATLQSAIGSYDEAQRRTQRAETEMAKAGKLRERRWIDEFAVIAELNASELQQLLSTVERRSEVLRRASEEADEITEEVVDIDAMGVEIEECSGAVAEVTKRLKDLAAERSTNRKTINQLTAETKELSKLEREKIRLSAELTTAELVESTMRRLGLATKTLTAAQKEYDRALKARADAHDEFVRHTAAALAQELIDNEPCPTCGSLHHPHPAKKTKGRAGVLDLASTDEQLAKSGAILKEAQSEYDRVQGQADGLETSIDAKGLAKQARDLENKIVLLTGLVEKLEILRRDDEKIETAIVDCRDEMSETKGELTRVTTASKTRTDALRKRIGRFEKTHGPLVMFEYDDTKWLNFLDALKDSLEATATYEAAMTDRDSVSKILAPHLAKWSVTAPDSLKAFMMSVTEIEQQRIQLRNNDLRRNIVGEAVAKYERSGAPTTRPDFTELEDRALRAKDLATELNQKFGAVNQTLVTVDDANASLTSDQAAIDQQHQQVEEANTLYLLCSGQSAANNEVKVALEDWVLSDYLKKVLRQANVRMKNVTNGRFELEVSSLGGDGRGRHGLDLDVFDANTGKSRRARTLSGGETFKAALALALGLADVVAAGKNKELGALFIDEGFGSLDSDSLESVIGVLDSLQDGGRVVGVISHVEEIKQSIPRGITVRPTDRGSIAEVHYPED